MKLLIRQFVGQEIVHLLLDACHARDNKELVKRLVSARDSERMTALYFAVANGHLKVSIHC